MRYILIDDMEEIVKSLFDSALGMMNDDNVSDEEINISLNDYDIISESIRSYVTYVKEGLIINNEAKGRSGLPVLTYTSTEEKSSPITYYAEGKGVIDAMTAYEPRVVRNKRQTASKRTNREDLGILEIGDLRKGEVDTTIKGVNGETLILRTKPLTRIREVYAPVFERFGYDQPDYELQYGGRVVKSNDRALVKGGIMMFSEKYS